MEMDDPCQGQTFHGDRGHPAPASNSASTTWVWGGTEGEEELVRIPAFPEAQCCLISGKGPVQHREDGLEWDHLGLHP